MELKLALAGDTMLGRGVAEQLRAAPHAPLFASDVVAAAAEADLFVLNLECSISTRGERWPDPSKPFFFRAPPAAVHALHVIGVDCVTLANNHALDYGRQALLDTFEHLDSCGIAWAGAGADERAAHTPSILASRDGFRLAVVSAADYPQEYAAGPSLPGVAYVDFRHELPQWLLDAIGSADADAVLVSPHWGPNMAASPLRSIRAGGAALVRAGATLVAGHSAHVFHGIEGRILYDLGDFLDDYAVEPLLRNDLGLLFFVTLDERGPRRLEAVPLKLGFCHTRLATGDDAAWIRWRFRRACALLGTQVGEEDGRLVVSWAD